MIRDTSEEGSSFSAAHLQARVGWSEGHRIPYLRLIKAVLLPLKLQTSSYQNLVVTLGFDPSLRANLALKRYKLFVLPSHSITMVPAERLELSLDGF